MTRGALRLPKSAATARTATAMATAGCNPPKRRIAVASATAIQGNCFRMFVYLPAERIETTDQRSFLFRSVT